MTVIAGIDAIARWWSIREETDDWVDYTWVQGDEPPHGNFIYDGPFTTEHEAEQDCLLWCLSDLDAEEDE